MTAATDGNDETSPQARFMAEVRHVWSLAAASVLGEPGRMISHSKTGYDSAHPSHLTVFNANVCIAAYKVWWGDLDLALDEPILKELAVAAGDVVHVLWERAGRFESEQDPLIDAAVYSVAPSGQKSVDPRYAERGPDRILRRRPA